MIDEPDFEDLLPLLSVPGEVHDPGPRGVSRRRFLQGLLASAGAASLVGTRWADHAFGSPIAAGDGVLVMVMLGGGNDGLNLLAPISGPDRTRYDALRGGIALPAAELLPAAGGYGFHPRMPNLRARYAAGRVAVVQGVGQPGNDLSHFTSMATFMAGTAGTSRSSGWLGRYLDGVTEWDSGMRGISFSSSVPLHLLGSRARVTALPVSGNLFGSNTAERHNRAVHAAVEAFAAGPTGLSAWGDRVAGTGRAAITTARTVNPIYQPTVTTRGLVRDLTHAARLINADLGVRVIGVTIGGWDTHANQLYDQGELLGALDTAIEAFFATLSPAFRDQTALATFSEFGRRPERNGSNGTDHGTASVMLVAGENVRGGLHGAAPSLTALDTRGNLVPTVDFRSVYATLLDRWLDGDPTAVLGGSFEQLDLFTNVPGGPRNPAPPPPPPNPATPFADWTALVRQQYLDLLLVDPAADRVATWVANLQALRTTPVDLIVSFLASPTSTAEVQPVLRAYAAAFGRPPSRSELTSRVATLRRSGLAAVCQAMVTSAAFTARNGSLRATSSYIRWVYAATLRTTPSASRLRYWTDALTSRRHSRGSMLAHFLVQSSCVAALAPEAAVGHLYAGMLHRVPTAAHFAARVQRHRAGTALRTQVAEIFGTAEYARRFA
jgi:uncharacterized protein (DUF1501 family)